MSDQQAQWFEAGPSASPAEAQALRDFRSLLLPSLMMWAWSNLTFIDPSGRPSEIDVILLHRNGLFLLEFKGFHGTIEGNQQDWRLTAPTGAVRSTRNPFLNTQTKAQRLSRCWNDSRAGKRVAAISSRGSRPSPSCTGDSVVKLDPIARMNTYGLDGYNVAGVPPLSEMLKAAPADSRDMIDTPRAKEIVRLMGKAGFTPRPATLKIGEYVVDDPDPIREGNGWADWRAVHPVMRSEFRRYLRLRRSGRRERSPPRRSRTRRQARIHAGRRARPPASSRPRKSSSPSEDPHWSSRTTATRPRWPSTSPRTRRRWTSADGLSWSARLPRSLPIRTATAFTTAA